MDNLPKYNPMEIDEDVYPIRGIDMIEEQKKDCKLCKYAPVISLIALDFIGTFNGLSRNSYWYLFEMMFALLYLRHITSVNDIFIRKPNGSIEYKPYGILIGVMFGITVRSLFMLFSSSIGYVPQG
jgi:hypothetical protein